jgi:hypothetical protein
MPGKPNHSDGPCKRGSEDGERDRFFRCRELHNRPMKRFAIWIFYIVGALAICYLAIYAYLTFTGHPLRPGKPIQIYRNPDGPDFS